MTAIDLDDWTSAPFIDDPYEHFGRLRETDPVHWNPLTRAWIVTRHSDVTALLRQPQRFSSAESLPGPAEYVPPIRKEDWGLVNYLNAWDVSLIKQDRPEHRLMRDAVHRWFTPRAVEKWRAQLREQAGELIRRRLAAGELDVKNDFAVSLPLQTIGLMLDVPASDTARLQQLSAARMGLLGIAPDRARRAASAHFELEDYFAPLIEARRGNGSEDDLISLLAAGEVRGDYDRIQCLATVVLLLIAGHETTQNLISNGIHAFARHPEQWQLLCDDPEKYVSSAVEECLRFEPSVKALGRVCAEDLELGDRTLKAGDHISWVISSANRDPRVFDRADEFDITRSPNPHVAFGGGIHHCLGSSLARVEAQEAFLALAEVVPRLQLKEETVEYVPSPMMRELRALHLVPG
ncbi:cytochrome P450 [Streptomyces sp. B21-083]|uniref:cytochrome P450 n=1 Tax=Streptomyces sp. B21-083 TaxID=3039410 RepID=UPI002FF0AA39